MQLKRASRGIHHIAPLRRLSVCWMESRPHANHHKEPRFGYTIERGAPKKPSPKSAEHLSIAALSTDTTPRRAYAVISHGVCGHCSPPPLTTRTSRDGSKRLLQYRTARESEWKEELSEAGRQQHGVEVHPQYFELLLVYRSGQLSLDTLTQSPSTEATNLRASGVRMSSLPSGIDPWTLTSMARAM